MWGILISVSAVLSPAAPAGSPASVRAITIDGAAVQGVWNGVDAGGSVILGQDTADKPLRLEELMLLTWESPSTAPVSEVPAPVVVRLLDGSRLRGNLLQGDEGTLLMATDGVPDLSLRMSDLVAISWPRPEAPDAERLLQETLRGRHPSEDTFILWREGKTSIVRGVTRQLGPQGGSFVWRNREVPFKRETTYAIVFAAGVSKPARQAAMCELTDGTVWAGRLVGGDRTSVKLSILQDRIIDLPVGRIREIRFQSGRVVYLDALDPSAFACEPISLADWPYRKNRSVANRPMRIGDVSFEHGIGVHSRATLDYELSESFKQFAAVIGIDEAARPLGHVVYQVLVDGKPVFDSGPITGRDDPRSILVPIDGAKKLRLVVDYGDQLDVGDQANWGNARLIK